MGKPPTHDLFLSYRSRYLTEVAALVDVLAQHGVRVWWDMDQIRGGDVITAALRAALAGSRALAVYVTDDYFDSSICAWELGSAWVAAERIDQARRRVILLRPPASGPLRHARLGPLLDSRAFDLPLDDLAGVAVQIAEHLASIDQRPLGELAPLAHASRWYPFARTGSNHFLGRTAELWELHGKLQRSRRVGVSGHIGPDIAQVRGFGGIGKTLLVIEYARRFEAAWPGGIFWFDARLSWIEAPAADQAALTAHRLGIRHELFADLGSYLGVPPNPTDPRAVARAIEQAFAEQTEGRPYLWIVDNLPPGTSQPTIEALMPPDSQGALLATTRWCVLDSLGELLDLDALAPDASFDLLTREHAPSTSDEVTAARRITAAVGHHPLAVDVLRVIVSHTAVLDPTPWDTWRQRLDQPGEDLLDRAADGSAAELPHGRASAISTVLLTSIDDRSPLALDILRVASILADAPIPGYFLAAVLHHRHDTSALDVEAALAELAAHALLSKQREQRSLIVHALIRRVIEKRCSTPEQLEQIREIARRVLLRRTGNLLDVRAHGPLLELYPHALVLANGASLAASELHVRLADFHSTRRDHSGALAHEIVALAIRERLCGPEHLDTLVVRQRIADTWEDLGRPEEARGMWEGLLATYERLVGPEHPATLNVLHHIAITMRAHGDHAQAREHLEKVLRGRLRTLGPRHAHTLVTMQELARLHDECGRNSEARPLLEQALAVMEEVHGPDHTDTLTTMQSLALNRRALGDMSGARALAERALATVERVLGPDHPNTHDGRNTLATILRAQQDLRGARDLYERSLTGKTRALGSDHPDTLTTAQNLAALLYESGELDAAYDCYETLVPRMEQVLGPDHPSALIGRQGFAWTLHCRGEFDAARARFEQVLEAQLRVLSPDHPNSMVTLKQLGATYVAQADYARAAQCLAQLFDAEERNLGGGHPRTTLTLQNLACMRELLGDTAAARSMFERALDLQNRVPGPGHPYTCTTRINLVKLLALHDPLAAEHHLGVLESLVLGPSDDRPDAGQSLVERLAAVEGALARDGLDADE